MSIGNLSLYSFKCSQNMCLTYIRGARAQRMGGVWGREEETEDEEEEAKEEEAEEEEEEGEEEKEVSWRGGSPFGGGEGVSYEDEEVNRALVVNIKEKITKLEERVSELLATITRILVFKVIEKEASLKKRLEAQEVFIINPLLLLFLFGKGSTPELIR